MRMRVDVNVNVIYLYCMTIAMSVKTDRKWGVQAFAALFDVTPRAVRFYEDKGLITPARESGSRVFGPADYLRFERILRAKRIGFTLGDIKEVLDVTDGVVTDRLELLRRRENFGRVIKSLSRRRDDIDFVNQEMTELCDLLDDHLAKADADDHGLAFAADYEAALRRHLDDDFAPDVTITEIPA